MVVIREPFGRVKELWSEDVGIGPGNEQFDKVYDEDLVAAIGNEAEVVI